MCEFVRQIKTKNTKKDANKSWLSWAHVDVLIPLQISKYTSFRVFNLQNQHCSDYSFRNGNSKPSDSFGALDDAFNLGVAAAHTSTTVGVFSIDLWEPLW